MVKLNEKLKAYQSKKDLNANETKEAAELVWEDYKLNNDLQLLIDTFMSIKIDICRRFVKEYFKTMTKNDLEMLCDLFVSSLTSSVAIEKSIFFCCRFWKTGVSDNSVSRFIVKISKVYSLSGKNKQVLKNKLLSGTDYKILSIDFSNEEPSDIKSLYATLKKLYETEDVPGPVLSWMENTGLYKSVNDTMGDQKNQLSSADADRLNKCEESIQSTDQNSGNSDKSISVDENIDEKTKSDDTPQSSKAVIFELAELHTGIDRAQSKIEDLNETISEVLKSVNNKRWTVFGLQEEIKKKDDEISRINRQYQEAQSEINRYKIKQKDMEDTIEKQRDLIDKKEATINDCEARIANLVNADRSDESQKVAELKAKIKNSFELSYEDFKAFTDVEYSSDKFQVLLADFKNIFRTLNRLGISFE